MKIRCDTSLSHTFLFNIGRHVLVNCCLMFCLGIQCPAAEPTTLRVLSYNIHHGEGIDGKLDLPRIASVITSAQPDIVALQEVDNGAMRTGSVDQPAELARLTKFSVVFGDNIKLQGGSYGNAVLSRYPVKRSENHPLPPFDKGERRGLLEVEFALPSGEPVILFATHLDHQRPAKERNAAAQLINKRASTLGDQPAILAGDLNDRPTSDTLKMLEAGGWKRTNEKPMGTVPVKSPVRQIDFILTRPNHDWRVVETKVLEEEIASDHRPILSVLELSREKAETPFSGSKPGTP